MKLVTLKKRREFLRIRDGARFHANGFILEGKRRESEGAGTASGGTAGASVARFGFTVTKRLGGAVRRNRIRRRLKAAVEATAGMADAETDYVIVAKAAAFDVPFDGLVGALETGFRVVNRRLQAAAGRAGEPPCRHGRRRGGGNRADDPSNTASGNNAGGVSQ